MAAVLLSSKAIGSVIKTTENGVSKEFIVAKHGYPTSGNGRTLLVRRYVHPQKVYWNQTLNNAYSTSTVDSWLNNDYLLSLSATIQAQISPVTIQHTVGNGNWTVTGLSRKVFILSATEYNATPDPGTAPGKMNVEGTPLTEAFNYLWPILSETYGTTQYSYTRTPSDSLWTPTNEYGFIFATMPDNIGYVRDILCYYYSNYVRPAFTVSSSMLILDDGTLTVNTAPTIPASITIPTTILGGTTISISWSASTDAEGNLAGYILQRSINSGSTWTQIFQGAATSTTNLVEFGTPNVTYRVLAYDTEGLQSGWRTSSQVTVINNTAPTIPSYITIPTTILGGTTIAIAWGPSTDPDGNLSGYILQRSVNGGSTWVQIFQGPQLQTTDNIVFGTASVMYRVLAFDTAGFESGWRTSSQVTVINNRPPTAPAGIQVPVNIAGGTFIVITWGASTDPDDNLVGYNLNRSVDGLVWQEVYKGPNLNFTDFITLGWGTVQYDVRAFDTYNAYSDSTRSPVRVIDNNRPPTITSATSGDMGVMNADFSWTYTVNDEDGDVVTVVEKVNNVEKRTFTATLGQVNTFDVSGAFFMKLLNGQHTMQVIATDSRSKSATHTVTFTKAVYSLSIQLKTPLSSYMAYGSESLRVVPISRLVMNIVRSIPPDANFHVLATNNANDPTPVWEDITQNILHGYNYIFSNTTVLNGNAFSFKITASRGPSNTGGFVSTIGGAFD